MLRLPCGPPQQQQRRLQRSTPAGCRSRTCGGKPLLPGSRQLFQPKRRTFQAGAITRVLSLHRGRLSPLLRRQCCFLPAVKHIAAAQTARRSHMAEAHCASLCPYGTKPWHCPACITDVYTVEHCQVTCHQHQGHAYKALHLQVGDCGADLRQVRRSIDSRGLRRPPASSGSSGTLAIAAAHSACVRCRAGG